jgi:hypothetical protein
LILRLKEARKGRSGRKRVVVTETAEDALLHGRIDKRSGAFSVEGGHLMVDFPAHEAIVVWELLKQAFEGKFLGVPVGAPHGRAPRKRRVPSRRRPHRQGPGARFGN